jgi:MoaA/NifB/PqqE/SkfB family radical SAM enzyme
MIRKNPLQEIIWEITPKCYSNCEWCGSKSLKNKFPLFDEDIIKIARKIADYPPDEVNIIGGDPLTVSLQIHVAIVEIFRYNKIRAKIIINPKSFFEKSDDEKEKYGKILKLYDLIGVSVNSLEDIALANLLPWKLRKKYVIITNFNTTNMWSIPTIAEFVREVDTTWQVQYTVGNFDSTIYDKKEAVKTLKSLLLTEKKNKTNILIADNMSNGTCSAGTRSCGILYNGDVTPCVSQRSYLQDPVVVGNILEKTLENIWETDENWTKHGYRLENSSSNADFITCKKVCENKIDLEDDVCGDCGDWNDFTKQYHDLQKQFPQEPIRIYYGVTTKKPLPANPPEQPNQPFQGTNVMMYAVQKLDYTIDDFKDTQFE